METNTVSNRKSILILAVILAVTFASYVPALRHDFVNWDDDTHLTSNPLVRSLSLPNIKLIFSSLQDFAYFPLTILSFAVEYHFFGYKPFIYHLDNVLLHLAVVALIFYFVRCLGVSTRAAGLAALLFGIHPMHVESVAWVTERKDVLYSFFYMLALIFYLRYLKTRRISFYFFTMILGMVSLLVKPMAVSLPFVLLICDWFQGRKLEKRLFWEKIPFLFYIVPIMWVSYSQNARIPGHHLSEAFLVLSWTTTFYIRKFFWPLNLIPVYHLPRPVTVFNFEYINALLILFLVVWAWVRFKDNRVFIFALLFYLCSIFPLLRFDDVKEVRNFSVVADRFMYLPSLGVCLWLGTVGDQILSRFSKHRSIKSFLTVFCFLILYSLLFFKTNYQTNIWKNSLTLWNYVIERSPSTEVAYNNRGIFYKTKGKPALAFQDYSRTIAINPDFSEAYHNRANLYAAEGRYDLAVEDYTRALNCSARFVDSYRNRGLVYTQMQQYDLAVKDFNDALKMVPRDAALYFNRGNVFLVLGQYERAVADYTRAVDIDPRYAAAYLNRSQAHRLKQEYHIALQDAFRAKSLGVSQPVDDYIGELIKLTERSKIP